MFCDSKKTCDFCSPRGPRSSDASAAVRTPEGSDHPHSKETGPLRKMENYRARDYKVSSEQLVVPKIKEVVKNVMEACPSHQDLV